MSTRSTDNAFPVHSTDFFDGSPIGTTTHHGRSKREYFSAMALQGLLASTHWSFYTIEQLSSQPTPSGTDFAAVSVQQADALIAKLSERTE